MARTAAGKGSQRSFLHVVWLFLCKHFHVDKPSCAVQTSYVSAFPGRLATSVRLVNRPVSEVASRDWNDFRTELRHRPVVQVISASGEGGRLW